MSTTKTKAVEINIMIMVPRKIDARAIGLWAVHTSYDESGYTVTHIPSGKGVRRSLSKKTAYQLLRALAESGIDASAIAMSKDTLSDIKLIVKRTLGEST